MEVRGLLYLTGTQSQFRHFGATSVPNPDFASRSLFIYCNSKFKIYLVYDQV